MAVVPLFSIGQLKNWTGNEGERGNDMQPALSTELRGHHTSWMNTEWDLLKEIALLTVMVAFCWLIVLMFPVCPQMGSQYSQQQQQQQQQQSVGGYCQPSQPPYFSPPQQQPAAPSQPPYMQPRPLPQQVNSESVRANTVLTDSFILVFVIYKK